MLAPIRTAAGGRLACTESVPHPRRKAWDVNEAISDSGTSAKWSALRMMRLLGRHV